MPSDFPLKERDVIKLLKQHGFTQIRQRGSHKRFGHSDGRKVTVAIHKGKEASPAILRKIVSDIGISREQFFGIKKRPRRVENNGIGLADD